MTEEYVTRARAAGASDIHLVAGLTPRCRVDGAIRPLGEEVLTPQQSEELVQELAEIGRAHV